MTNRPYLEMLQRQAQSEKDGRPKPKNSDDLVGPSNDYAPKTKYGPTPIKKVEANAKTFSEVKFTNSARQAKYEANLKKAEKMRAETLAELAKE